MLERSSYPIGNRNDATAAPVEAIPFGGACRDHFFTDDPSLCALGAEPLVPQDEAVTLHGAGLGFDSTSYCDVQVDRPSGETLY